MFPFLLIDPSKIHLIVTPNYSKVWLFYKLLGCEILVQRVMMIQIICVLWLLRNSEKPV